MWLQDPDLTSALERESKDYHVDFDLSCSSFFEFIIFTFQSEQCYNDLENDPVSAHHLWSIKYTIHSPAPLWLRPQVDPGRSSSQITAGALHSARPICAFSALSCLFLMELTRVFAHQHVGLTPFACLLVTATMVPIKFRFLTRLHPSRPRFTVWQLLLLTLHLSCLWL